MDAIYRIPDAPDGACIDCGRASYPATQEEVDRLAGELAYGDSVLRVVDVRNGLLLVEDLEDGRTYWHCPACLDGK